MTDESDPRIDCYTCRGTGIGQHGDPDTSRCYACGGKGWVWSEDRAEDEDDHLSETE